jgi:hypothetical protein
MGHDDVAGLVQGKVTLGCELCDCLVDVRFVHRSQVTDQLAARRVPLASEGVIDNPAHPLENVMVHRAKLPGQVPHASRTALPDNSLSCHLTACRGRASRRLARLATGDLVGP